ncbi:MAG TPA: hypothetical protein VFB43_06860 [Terracidiphilus sp.]|nr:hypothetical protein [Terracidiphilus sp.]
MGMLIFAACCLLPKQALSQCATGNVAEIVGKVVQHELNLAPTQGRWMYLASYVEGGVRITARRIQTEDGILTWVLSRDGRLLSQTEIEKQRQHLNDLLSDQSFLDANRKAMRDDAVHINTLFADLPQSVQFDCPIQNGSVSTIHFEPKPGYSPWNVEKRIIAGMSGTIQVDLKQMRMKRLSSTTRI